MAVYRAIYLELFLLAALSKAYILNGLTSFQLPPQNTIVLGNNGTLDSKKINVAKESLGATFGGPKIVENPLSLDLHKRVKRAVSLILRTFSRNSRNSHFQNLIFLVCSTKLML